VVSGRMNVVVVVCRRRGRGLQRVASIILAGGSCWGGARRRQSSPRSRGDRSLLVPENASQVTRTRTRWRKHSSSWQQLCTPHSRCPLLLHTPCRGPTAWPSVCGQWWSVKNREGRRISETLNSVVGFLSKLNATSGIGFGRAPLPGNVKTCSRIWSIPLPECRELSSVQRSQVLTLTTAVRPYEAVGVLQCTRRLKSHNPPVL
jgi:hypothetical protein